MRFLSLNGLDASGHRATFDKVRAAIERGDLRSPDVKKLASSPYHRAKLDAKNRLLLHFLRHGGETVCLALEIVENHAYDRARFLRGATLDEARIELEPVAEAPEAQAIRYLHDTRAALEYLDKPISFDDAQATLLTAPAPLVVIGSAGSGKTALTLAKLREAPGTVAYITQSSFLADTARSIYFAHGWSREDQEAEFLSLRNLIEAIRVPAGKPVTFQAFAGFFARVRRDYRFTDAHQAFEELRGVIGAEPEGPLSLEAYLALGPRQSIYAAAERAALHALFERYLRWLDEAALYDPNLVAQKWLELAEPRYDFVVVDEVQDMTNAELTLVLKTLRKPGQFLLCGDANQIVHPNFFSWSRLRSLFFRDESLAGDRKIGVLDANYRNARAVTRTANRLLEIKHARFGSIDRESDALVRPVGDEEGAVVTLPDDDAVVRDLDEKLRRSAKVAVIVLRDEQKEEARRRFRTPLVFSVHEAKGLEYETVVLYGVVSSERAAYADLCDGVSADELGKSELTYGRARDKGDKSLEVYKFFVNALFVALTRAVKQVYLVEKDRHHRLLSLLGARAETDAQGVRAEASSLEAWQAEARRLELQGKTEQADAIRATVVRTQKVPWLVVDAAGHDELAAKALMPKSIFGKAKQSLTEWALFHGNAPLLCRLGLAPPRIGAELEQARRRQRAPYSGKFFKDILDQTDRFGVDYRTPMGTTPLMMAAAAGNVGLTQALVARGARRDLVDPFGRAAMHHALREAYMSEDFATRALGPIWELVAMPAVDVLVEGHLVRLAPVQAEYFVFAAMLTLMPSVYSRYGRWEAVSADLLSMRFGHLPPGVLAAKRQRRTYLNGVLARAEVASPYRPARRLWLRERRGEYVPNPDLALRVVDDKGEESWRPIPGHLGLVLLDQHVEPLPRGPVRAAVSSPASLRSGPR